MRKTQKMLAFAILFLGLLSSPVHAQDVTRSDITIDVKNGQIKEVLKKITESSDYKFFYDESITNDAPKINLKLSNVSLDAVLAELEKQTGFKFIVKDNTITVSSKSVANSLTAQPVVSKTISGTVVDKTGEPIIGASVYVKGTNIGTATDMNGKFSLTADPKATLVVSYLGYKAQEIAGGVQPLSVSLVEDDTALEEVVVLGYGASARKADLTASVGIVQNMETLKNRPATSMTSMLQGQVPGVTVRNRGAGPGDGPQVIIRGQGSRNTESPLWVVDGVPGAPYNMNDVESIVILKDAASAAIYGSNSGASGVIMITTRKSKEGKASVTYEGTFGISQPQGLMQSLTAEEQIAVRKQAYAAGNMTLNSGWDTNINPWVGTTRTDWVDAIFRVAPYQRHFVALNGGTETFTNRLSMQFNDMQSELISSYNKELNIRYDAAFKLHKNVRVREDFIWNTWDTRQTAGSAGGEGVVMHALSMPRSAIVRNPDGTYGGTTTMDPEYIAKYGSNFADIQDDQINPVRQLEQQTIFNRPQQVNTSTYLDILDPIPGLKFTSRFTYKLSQVYYKSFTPRRPEPGKPNNDNALNYSSSRYNRWENENTLNYDNTFGEHTIGVLLAHTVNKSSYTRFSTDIADFEDEDERYQYITNGTSSRLSAGDSFSESGNGPDTNIALIGRLAYSFDNRYFVTGTFRRDYAGRLPQGKKYGDFPGFTFGWKLSEEAFFPKTDFINLVKFRGGWGRIGNLGSIGLATGTPTLDAYLQGGGMPFGTYMRNQRLVNPSAAFNPFLTWETSEQTDFGIDLGLFNERLNISAEWYNKRTFNLIRTQDSGWPSYIGIAAGLVNDGEITNKGLEFTLGWNDRIGKNWNYFVNGNLATLKNKVTNIGPVNPETGEKPVWTDGGEFRSTIYPYRTREGDPMYTYWLIKSDGLFQSDAEAAAYVDKNGNRIQPNAVAGDLKFIDQNGDGLIDDKDRIYMNAYYPDITYALTGGFSYKHLSFSLMLQGVTGANVFHAGKYQTLNEGYRNYNRWNKILEAYPKSNDIPRITVNDVNKNFSTNSDWYLEDASYLRIKNINLSYQFDKFLHGISYLKERNSSLSLYLSIDNVYTLTKYSGMEPEVEGLNGMDSGTYPMPRVFAFGIKVTY
jgi:TonB-linked SusC/RagA family outer membrane protein